MHVTCCQTCGHAEIGDEAAGGAHGYVFFHTQDAARLAPGSSELFLAFGVHEVAPGAPPEQVRAAEEAVAAGAVSTLRAHGLEVDRDGSSGSRIRLPRVDWRNTLRA